MQKRRVYVTLCSVEGWTYKISHHIFHLTPKSTWLQQRTTIVEKIKIKARIG